MFESSIWSPRVLPGFLPQSNNKHIRVFEGSTELLKVSLSDLSRGVIPVTTVSDSSIPKSQNSKTWWLMVDGC